MSIEKILIMRIPIIMKNPIVSNKFSFILSLIFKNKRMFLKIKEF